MNISHQAVYLGTKRYFRTVSNLRRVTGGAMLGDVKFKALGICKVQLVGSEQDVLVEGPGNCHWLVTFTPKAVL